MEKAKQRVTRKGSNWENVTSFRFLGNKALRLG